MDGNDDDVGIEVAGYVTFSRFSNSLSFQGARKSYKMLF